MTCKSQTLYDIENCNGNDILAALGIGWTVEFTVGAEAADVINVALQIQDAAGADLAEAKAFLAWLSDTAGVEPTTTAPSVGTTIGTDGELLYEPLADIVLELLTDTDGVLDLDIEEAAVDTWFLNVRLADGSVVSSAAITFA